MLANPQYQELDGGVPKAVGQLNRKHKEFGTIITVKDQQVCLKKTGSGCRHAWQIFHRHTIKMTAHRTETAMAEIVGKR